MTITAFGAWHAAGVVLGVAIVFFCAERRGVTAARVAALTVVSFAAACASALLAGRLVAAPLPDAHGNAWSGLGFPVCLAAGWALARAGHMPMAFVDACGVALLPALALGRVGCWFAHCCGSPSAPTGGYRIVCPPSPAPTQLLEATALALVAPIVVVAWRRGGAGAATAAFLGAFGVVRMFVGFWRPGLAEVIPPLNVDQIAALFTMILAALIGAATKPGPRSRAPDERTDESRDVPASGTSAP